MSPNKLDPAALVPDQRVRLRWPGWREFPEVERVFQNRSGPDFTFLDSFGQPRVFQLEDGELFDWAGRIVEVRDGETA